MPSSNPGRPQPVRRPKVAGLRRPSPSPRPQDEPPQDVETPEAGENLFTPAPKPSPRRKSRDEGTAKPSDFAEAEAALTEPEAEPEPRADRPRRNPYVLAGALFGLAIVLAGFATWFKIEDNHVTAATENTALLDAGRTAQVNQAATSAAETLFSYDFNDIAKTQNAAKDLLLNDEVKATYNNLMGEVERLAPQQKIVVTVKASRSAVVMLNGDFAKVMVFVDQTATRTDQNQTSSGSAQLWLQMQYVDGKWKVSNLNTYNSEQPASPAPSQPPASATQAPPPSR